jgi:hypothetical protein
VLEFFRGRWIAVTPAPSSGDILNGERHLDADKDNVMTADMIAATSLPAWVSGACDSGMTPWKPCSSVLVESFLAAVHKLRGQQLCRMDNERGMHNSWKSVDPSAQVHTTSSGLRMQHLACSTKILERSVDTMPESILN